MESVDGEHTGELTSFEQLITLCTWKSSGDNYPVISVCRRHHCLFIAYSLKQFLLHLSTFTLFHLPQLSKLFRDICFNIFCSVSTQLFYV